MPFRARESLTVSFNDQKRGENRFRAFLHLASCTPAPIGLIKWGFDVGLFAGLVFRLRKGTVPGDIRGMGWAFQVELEDVSGLVSRFLEFIEAMRCSLAFRLALVSRANRGVGLSLDAEGGVDVCAGDSRGGVMRL